MKAKMTKHKADKTERKGSFKKPKLKKKSAKPFKASHSFKEKMNKTKSEIFSGKWFEEFKYSGEATSENSNLEEVQALKKEATALYNEAVMLNSSKSAKTLSSADYSWVKTVISKGTRTDKVAAYTLLIQDSPVYNLSLLRNMVEMVKIGKNKDCFMAIDTLCELFLNDLLPPDRKLLLFVEQPLSKLNELTSGNVVTRKRRLLLWYFEDQLKSMYGDFIIYLNKIAHDSVDANKEKVISVMCKLLEGNPERESMLLSNVVNKIGDPSHKVGSKVIYVLTKLLETHPNMREVVAEAVEKVIFRSNINKRAQYYSICFLSQFWLYNGEGKLAKHLITIYLSLFKACIKTGDIDSRMMNALLMGVKRAYPYAKEELGMLKDHIDTIYKVIHLSNANIAIQALSLAHLVSDYSKAYVDRFYRVLYQKIGEPSMFKSSHHAMFISLIYKALKSDQEKNRVYAFMKRLFQVSIYIPIPVACGVLIMVSEVLKLKKDIIIKETVEDSTAVIKLEEDSDDGEERYEDVKEEVSGTTEEVETKPVVDKVQPVSNIQFVEPLKTWRNPDKSPEDFKDSVKEYNPFVRNPLYAGAERSMASELLKLSNHFHPTISLFAKKIINGEKIIYSGDPLLDFTLIRFLDKFSFKKPKEIKPEEEQKLTFMKFGRKKYYSSATVRRLRANTIDYLNHSEKNIPVDEIFLYRYMKEKIQKEGRVKKEEDESDVESVNSDEFEEMLTGLADDKNDDINFLGEVGKLPKKAKKKDDEDEGESDLELDDMEDESNAESENDGDESDAELPSGKIGKVKKSKDEDDSEAEDFEGDEIDDFEDEDEEMMGSDLDEAELQAHFKDFKLPDLSNLKGSKNKNKKKGKDFKSSLFASADEFSELLEDVDDYAGGSEALSNKDRAAAKQLKWESERDKWINQKNYRRQGRNRSFGGKKNGNVQKGGKRPFVGKKGGKVRNSKGSKGGKKKRF